jgi:hypothetical protein
MDQIKNNFQATNVVNKNYLTKRFYALKMDEQDTI